MFEKVWVELREKWGAQSYFIALIYEILKTKEKHLKIQM